ncbi:MAG TPA: response regulator [bacterium]|nr:response regulator [bacterium]
MTTLPSLLAGLPATTALPLLPTQATAIPLYSALVDGAPVSVVVLRETAAADSRFFMSAEPSVFHELARADAVYRHDTPGFLPILTRTPGLVSMAVLDNEHSVTLLKNDPDRADRLQTYSFLRNKNLPANAALFVFPDGETPAFEGGLARWWGKMAAREKPTFQIPAADLSHVVGRIAHKINNGMSPILSYADMMEPGLSGLMSFFDVLAKSEAVSRAMTEELRRLPEMREALDDLSAFLPPSPVTDENPLGLLRAVIEDLRQQSVDIAGSSEQVISFVRTVQSRIPLEVPIGAADARELMRECEEGPEPAPAAEPAPVAAATAVAPKDPTTIDAPLLLVDDQEDVRHMLVTLLSRKGFTNIVAAASLTQALEEADKIPDLGVLLTDFNLSETETGLDLARRLRKRLPNLRVVLITGNGGGLNEQLTAEETVAFDRFCKPFDTGALITRLRRRFEETFSSSGR